MQIYELKKGLARKTFQFNCLISEPQLESILDVSPYREIREAAYDFLEEKEQIYISKENPGIRHCIVSNDVFCMGCSKADLLNCLQIKTCTGSMNTVLQ